MDLEIAEVPSSPEGATGLHGDFPEDCRGRGHYVIPDEDGVKKGVSQPIEKGEVIRPMVDAKSVLPEGIVGRFLQGADPGSISGA